METTVETFWNLESLNDAYRQGFVASMIGMDKERCPYRKSDEMLFNSWEAGYEDGRLTPETSDCQASAAV